MACLLVFIILQMSFCYCPKLLQIHGNMLINKRALHWSIKEIVLRFSEGHALSVAMLIVFIICIEISKLSWKGLKYKHSWCISCLNLHMIFIICSFEHWMNASYWMQLQLSQINSFFRARNFYFEKFNYMSHFFST